MSLTGLKFPWFLHKSGFLRDLWKMCFVPLDKLYFLGVKWGTSGLHLEASVQSPHGLDLPPYLRDILSSSQGLSL